MYSSGGSNSSSSSSSSDLAEQLNTVPTYVNKVRGGLGVGLDLAEQLNTVPTAWLKCP